MSTEKFTQKKENSGSFGFSQGEVLCHPYFKQSVIASELSPNKSYFLSLFGSMLEVWKGFRMSASNNVFCFASVCSVALVVNSLPPCCELTEEAALRPAWLWSTSWGKVSQEAATPPRQPKSPSSYQTESLRGTRCRQPLSSKRQVWSCLLWASATPGMSDCGKL